MTEPQRPVLSTWLSWDEFKLVFAVQWVAQHLECYGWEDMSDAERERIFGRLGSAMMWSVRKLALEGGYRFRALQVDREGVITSTQTAPIEPRNLLLLERIGRGKMPSPVNVPWGELRGAGGGFLEVALEKIAADAIDLDPEPLRSALSDVTAAVLEARAQITPEEVELQGEGFQNMLDDIGVAILPKKGLHAQRASRRN